MSQEVRSERATERSPEDSPPLADSEASETAYRREDLSDTDCTERTRVDPAPGSPTEPLLELPAYQPPKISETAKNRPTTYVHHRALFTDGLNSIWHVIFGLLAVKFPILVSLFIVYQSLDIYEVNVFVDIFEFLIGHFVGSILI
jgi:hypothetical protein